MLSTALYEMTTGARLANQWMGGAAQAVASWPGMRWLPQTPWVAAWGKVTERSYRRMAVKPRWSIEVEGQRVRRTPVMERAFAQLTHFEVEGRAPRARRVLVVAPISGHYATLLRGTVTSLLQDSEVYVTEWRNARDVPVDEGDFDVEHFAHYVADFIRALGPDVDVVAVCQPVPLTLVATAWLAAHEPDAQPASLTLMGGPVDPAAAPTSVSDFGHRVTMGYLERFAVQRVGRNYAGAGRAVYPGLTQLSAFMSMNLPRHQRAFFEQIVREAQGEARDDDAHNRFYDEYLAVMDMPAEFYLSTVARIFQGREVGRNAFTLDGERIDLGRIDRTPVLVVEGGRDDIAAPGQCAAALPLLTGLSDDQKDRHLEPDAGHYGIFAGRAWRERICPYVVAFMDRHARAGS